MPSALASGFSLLAQRGLGLCSAMSRARVVDAVPAAAEHWGTFESLLLVGNRGQELWTAMGTVGAKTGDNPVDTWVDSALQAAVAGPLAPLGPSIAWPGVDGVAPVSILAMAAHWGRPSPLGLFIHPSYGLWVAIRGVTLLSQSVPERLEADEPHPCDECDEPCLPACPASALSAAAAPDVRLSFAERLRPGAPCEARCLARGACPVGTTWRPGAEQQAHHQRAGNESWRRFAPSGSLPEWDRSGA